MNKLAAEKIASKYYELGCRLALTKQANFARHYANTVNALSGAGLGLGSSVIASDAIRGSMGKLSPSIEKILSKSDKIRDYKDKINMLTDDLALLKKNPGYDSIHEIGILGAEGRGLVTRDQIVEQLAKAKTGLTDTGALTTGEQIIDSLPDGLGLLAGTGVGIGAFKGLRKMDKKLGLY